MISFATAPRLDSGTAAHSSPSVLVPSSIGAIRWMNS